MIINKIVVGFVVQRYDTEAKRFINQEFIADDSEDWETPDGDTVKAPENPPTLNMEMVQPPMFPTLNMEMVQPPAMFPTPIIPTPLVASALNFDRGEHVIVTPTDDPDDPVKNEFMGTVVGIKNGRYVTVIDQEDNAFDCEPVQVHHLN